MSPQEAKFRIKHVLRSLTNANVSLADATTIAKSAIDDFTAEYQGD